MNFRIFLKAFFLLLLELIQKFTTMGNSDSVETDVSVFPYSLCVVHVDVTLTSLVVLMLWIIAVVQRE